MLVICAPNPVSPVQAGAIAGGAANLAVALFGEAASEKLVVLPPEVNCYGLLDVGVGVEGEERPLEGLAGLLCIRTDPTMRLPGAAEALGRITAIVVIDTVMHDTAKRANVVIAEGGVYAGEGTFTQGDFRVQRLAPATQPDGTVRCFDALVALGTALGVSLPTTADAALGEIAGANPQYQPAYDLIVGEGVRLEMEGSGRGRMVAVPAVAATGEGLRIITGRDLYTALDAAALRHPEADRLHRYDRVQVSEPDAARLGISDGDEVELSDGTVSLRAPATVTERVPPGAVYVSSLLQGGEVAQFFGGPALATVAVRSLAAVPA
jgi:predicted molibdopterin-dependent oxidoreductase YjgC